MCYAEALAIRLISNCPNLGSVFLAFLALKTKSNKLRAFRQRGRPVRVKNRAYTMSKRQRLPWSPSCNSDKCKLHATRLRRPEFSQRAQRSRSTLGLPAIGEAGGS